MPTPWWFWQNMAILATIFLCTIGIALISRSAEGLWSLFLLMMWLRPETRN